MGCEKSAGTLGCTRRVEFAQQGRLSSVASVQRSRSGGYARPVGAVARSPPLVSRRLGPDPAPGAHSPCACSSWARLESNQGPTDYESAALTAELRARAPSAYAARRLAETVSGAPSYLESMHRAVPYRALLVVAILTGCGGGDGEGGAGTSEAGAAPSGALTVSATDFAFAPAELTAEAGSVSIELVNDGDAPHAIEIEGNGVEESSETIDAGETTTLTVELEDGVYEVYCPVDGHREFGMVGTLTVGSGGGMSGGTGTGETETGETETDGTETDETGTDDGSDDDGRY